MKIQPIDFNLPEERVGFDMVKPVMKSRFKRFFEFPNFLRGATVERADGTEDFEPSTVWLDNMVQNFMEEGDDHHHCYCFNGKCSDSSDDEVEKFNCFGNFNHASFADTCEILKSLVLCTSISERNLLADTARIVEKNKIGKLKDDLCRKIVVDGLLSLSYDASICKSRWDKNPSYPAGEYDYVDVVIGGDRLIVDIDFRSEFEVARSTKGYKAILLTLPCIFVGKANRLQRIVRLVSEAAKQSLKKKGMPLPPWRKSDYVEAKWLSPYTRDLPPAPAPVRTNLTSMSNGGKETDNPDCIDPREPAFQVAASDGSVFGFDEEEKNLTVVKQWEPPEIKRKSVKGGGKLVAGLASVIEGTTP